MSNGTNFALKYLELAAKAALEAHRAHVDVRPRLPQGGLVESRQRQAGRQGGGGRRHGGGGGGGFSGVRGGGGGGGSGGGGGGGAADSQILGHWGPRVPGRPLIRLNCGQSR